MGVTSATRPPGVFDQPITGMNTTDRQAGASFVAKMDYNKAARRARASQDVREALEEGAIDDVFVFIDKDVPAKTKSSPAPSKFRGKRNAVANGNVNERRGSSKAAQAGNTAQRVDRDRSSNATKQTHSPAQESVDQLKNIIEKAGCQSADQKQLTAVDLLKEILVRSIVPIVISYLTNCVRCGRALKAGKNHFTVLPLDCFLCAPCAHDIKKHAAGIFATAPEVFKTKSPPVVNTHQDSDAPNKTAGQPRYDSDPYWRPLFVRATCTRQVHWDNRGVVQDMRQFKKTK